MMDGVESSRNEELGYDPNSQGHSLIERNASGELKTASAANGADFAFGEGDSSVRFWASDLSVEYVTFNSDYST